MNPALLVGAARREATTLALPCWVVGASGLLAGEFLRLLEAHPYLSLRGALTRGGGEPLMGAHAHLPPGTATVSLDAGFEGIAETLEDSDYRGVMVLALPHGEAAVVWRRFREQYPAAAAELVVVDLSADYRLQDPEQYQRWYGAHPDRDELGAFVYGLPEWNRTALRGARRIAAPGCFATALQIACLPAANAGLLDRDAAWMVQAITGSSGSGARPHPQTHHPHRHANLTAYALSGHRHEAELEQALGFAPRLCFLPHSGPFVRGIHLSAVLPLRTATTTAALQQVYTDAYGPEPFVRVRSDGPPQLRAVVGSNRVDLWVQEKNGCVVVLAALDNVLKGGAGQALQALNEALGFPAGMALSATGWGVF